MNELVNVLKESAEAQMLVCGGGFILGILFGWLGETSRFCMRAAVAEWTLDKAQDNPLRSTEYVAAMLASIIAVQILFFTTSIDFDQSIYRATDFRPLAFIVGGALFGIGMVLAGGCVSRMLILGSSGNIRSLYTLLFIGIAGYAANRGILAYLRVGLEDAASFSGSARTVDGLFGVSPFIGALIAGAPLLFVLLVLVRRTGVRSILPGVGIGALVGAGWWITGVLGADDFEPLPLASLTYTAPVGEALQYLMTYTGATINFGISAIAGVMVGAFLSSSINGRFQWIGFQYPTAPLRYALGGMLMGFGGVVGLGCPMGQGITGTGTLATGSFLLIASIAISAGLTYRIMGPMKSGPAAPAQ